MSFPRKPVVWGVDITNPVPTHWHRASEQPEVGVVHLLLKTPLVVVIDVCVYVYTYIYIYVYTYTCT